MIVSHSMNDPMSRFGRASLFAGLACVALLAASGFARAEAAGEQVHSVTVSYADLDISRPAGADVLYHRIRVAAREACGWVDRQWPVAYYTWRRCVENAVSGALVSLYEKEPGAASFRRDS